MKNLADEIEFKGYAAKQKRSEVSGLDRLYYDRNEPYTKNIKQWNNFEPAVTIDKPVAYIIPQAWEKVIGLLKLNRVKLQRLQEDTEIEVELYYIADYKTQPKPYEGHYLHSGVKLNTVKRRLPFYKGRLRSLCRSACEPVHHRDAGASGHRLLFQLELL